MKNEKRLPSFFPEFTNSTIMKVALEHRPEAESVTTEQQQLQEHDSTSIDSIIEKKKKKFLVFKECTRQ